MAFNSCRIPAPVSDVAYIYGVGNRDAAADSLSHVVVVRRGRFFKLDTTLGARSMTVAELAHQLRQVVWLADLDISQK